MVRGMTGVIVRSGGSNGRRWKVWLLRAGILMVEGSRSGGKTVEI